MIKPSVKSFLREFFLFNAILFVVYFAITKVISMFFGSAMLNFGAAISSGGKQSVFLTIVFIALQLAAFIGFYVFSWFKFLNNTEEKRAFLAEIGTGNFNIGSGAQKIFLNRGKYMTVYFTVTWGVLEIARLIGIPIPIFLIFSQTMLSNALQLMLGINAGYMSMILSIVSVIVNIALYYVYQRFICVKIYEIWADRRLRIE